MEILTVGKKIDTSKDNNENGLALTASWVSSKRPTYNDYRSDPTIVLPQTQITTGEGQYFGPGGVKPNHSRPPDWKGNNLALYSSQQPTHGEYPDKEEFVDASESGILSNDESEMDLVVETRGLEHPMETGDTMHFN
ncbi:hypothetical protein L195_g058468 [Trifolium pratense]|uniref:Uncharacterized protein n=1 Tax=Trifolium pratense TaxID=57577 RepID=A0A2K3JSG0_TRIPR|nr:hypothetical protein L195_g058468 [Trifolium pratense]